MAPNNSAASSRVPVRRPRAAATTALGLALVLLSACAGTAPVAGVGSTAAEVSAGGAEVSEPGAGGNGTGVVLVERRSGGAVLTQDGEDPNAVPGSSSYIPAPFGTTFEFLGWQATTAEAELTTQPNDDPSNPLSVVLQMTLTVTAPDPVPNEQRTSPFVPTPSWKTLDMVPCTVGSPDETPWVAGESRDVTSCHYFNDSEVGDDSPQGTITVRYQDFDYITRVYSEVTRGPDY